MIRTASIASGDHETTIAVGVHTDPLVLLAKARGTTLAAVLGDLRTSGLLFV